MQHECLNCRMLVAPVQREKQESTLQHGGLQWRGIVLAIEDRADVAAMFRHALSSASERTHIGILSMTVTLQGRIERMKEA